MTALSVVMIYGNLNKLEQARPYRDRLETADAEIRRHLDRASALIDRL